MKTIRGLITRPEATLETLRTGQAANRLLVGAVVITLIACASAVALRHMLPVVLSVGLAGPIGLVMALAIAVLQMGILIAIVGSVAVVMTLSALLMLALRRAPAPAGPFIPVFAASVAAASPLLIVPWIGLPLFIGGAGVCAASILARLPGLRRGAAVLAPMLPAVILLSLAIVVEPQASFRQALFGSTDDRTRHIRTALVVERLNQYARVEGHYPRHPVAMLPGPHHFPIGSLTAGGIQTFEDEVPLLADILAAPATQWPAMVDEVIDAIPPDTPALRVGDFVFTAGGIDRSESPADLWILILPSSPDADGTSPALVGTAAGRVTAMTAEELRSALVVQNALRQSTGLGVMPHPAEVESIPARATDPTRESSPETPTTHGGPFVAPEDPPVPGAEEPAGGSGELRRDMT